MTTLLVGRGLLGSAVSRRLLVDRVDLRTVSVPWSDSRAALLVLTDAADRAARSSPNWRLIWCAGSGVVASDTRHLEQEVELFRAFCATLPSPPAVMFLSSSAGGAYGGSPDQPPYDELSRAVPASPYGEAKLAMEEIAAGLSQRGTRILVGRLANLYGPGQDLDKPQGLISQICRAHAQREPLGVFVSLDTLRDYLFIQDAAHMVCVAMDRMSEQGAGTRVTKIFASGQSTSVGMVLQECNRAFRRRCLVVQRGAEDGGQGRDLRLRSQVWTDLDAAACTPLALGIRLTYEHVAATRRTGLVRTAVSVS